MSIRLFRGRRVMPESADRCGEWTDRESRSAVRWLARQHASVLVRCAAAGGKAAGLTGDGRWRGHENAPNLPRGRNSVASVSFCLFRAPCGDRIFSQDGVGRVHSRCACGSGPRATWCRPLARSFAARRLPASHRRTAQTFPAMEGRTATPPPTSHTHSTRQGRAPRGRSRIRPAACGRSRRKHQSRSVGGPSAPGMSKARHEMLISATSSSTAFPRYVDPASRK